MPIDPEDPLQDAQGMLAGLFFMVAMRMVRRDSFRYSLDGD